MPDSDVAAAFARYEPWITKYELREASSGGWFDAPNDPRLGLFRRCFPAARRILEQNRLSEFGRCDVIYCSGLLYHLPAPWKLVEQFAAVAPGLFLWTHGTGEARRLPEGGADEGWSGPLARFLLAHARVALHDAHDARLRGAALVRKRRDPREQSGGDSGGLCLIVRP